MALPDATCAACGGVDRAAVVAGVDTARRPTLIRPLLTIFKHCGVPVAQYQVFIRREVMDTMKDPAGDERLACQWETLRCLYLDRRDEDLRRWIELFDLLLSV